MTLSIFWLTAPNAEGQIIRGVDVSDYSLGMSTPCLAMARACSAADDLELAYALNSASLAIVGEGQSNLQVVLSQHIPHIGQSQLRSPLDPTADHQQQYENHQQYGIGYAKNLGRWGWGIFASLQRLNIADFNPDLSATMQRQNLWVAEVAPKIGLRITDNLALGISYNWYSSRTLDHQQVRAENLSGENLEYGLNYKLSKSTHLGLSYRTFMQLESNSTTQQQQEINPASAIMDQAVTAAGYLEANLGSASQHTVPKYVSEALSVAVNHHVDRKGRWTLSAESRLHRHPRNLVEGREGQNLLTSLNALGSQLLTHDYLWVDAVMVGTYHRQHLDPVVSGTYFTYGIIKKYNLWGQDLAFSIAVDEGPQGRRFFMSFF